MTPKIVKFEKYQQNWILEDFKVGYSTRKLARKWTVPLQDIERVIRDALINQDKSKRLNNDGTHSISI